MILSALTIGSLLFTFHTKTGQSAADCHTATAQNRINHYLWGGNLGCSVRRRRHRRETSSSYNYLERNCNKEVFSLFSKATSSRMQDKGLKLHQSQLAPVRFRLDTVKSFLVEKVVKHWNGPPREVVESPSLMRHQGTFCSDETH